MLALGNFDGLHRGHVKIIERVNRRAGERGSTSVVMTFDPHPPRVVRPDKAPPLIMTKAQRLEAIAASGIQGTAVVRFTHELSQWDPETFVRTVLAPSTQAAIALNQGRPDDALVALEAAVPTQLVTVAGLVPEYLRAEAFRRKGRLKEAIAENEALLEHRGVDPFAPVIPLAHLGLARARARAGDVAGSRRSYEDLFAIWKNADAGFLPLADARAEYDRLTSTAPRGTAGR